MGRRGGVIAITVSAEGELIRRGSPVVARTDVHLSLGSTFPRLGVW